ncbi:serine/threonine-protein phosphatase [Flavisolibacter sp. BT320]|nr:serine/threonine-protein phosphatase [Flavisolibacter longurius]
MIAATEIFCLNEMGRRANNEDNIFPPKGSATLNDRLFIVCDGVGGEKKGEVASEIVCRAIPESLSRQSFPNTILGDRIQKSIHYANAKLADYTANDTDAKRMSTTVALVYLGQNSVIAAWCGDSRIHHIRNGKILWQSKDHSIVSELVSQGELTEEEARRHPQRNVITRSLNALNYNSMAEYHEITNFETGDYLLLCSDGFLEQVNHDIINEILSDDNKKDKAKFFHTYCSNVTRDNYSMYLIRGEMTSKRKRPFISSKKAIAIVVVILLSILIFFLK